jgi:hypothetical protein
MVMAGSSAAFLCKDDATHEALQPDCGRHAALPKIVADAEENASRDCIVFCQASSRSARYSASHSMAFAA